jgi:hypothetical protein
MRFVNQLLNFLFDLVLLRFAGESPWPGLIVGSFLTAAVLVGIVRLTSNQKAVLRSRNRFLARTLELLLFQHDLRVSVTACGRIVAANTVYLGQLSRPMAVGVVPLVLMFIQMETWFGYRPLHVGEAAVLTVRLDPSLPVVSTPVELRLPSTVRLDSLAVRAPKNNELAWRIVADDFGEEPIEVTVVNAVERKSLAVGSKVIRVSPRRESSGFVSELFSPSEPPLAKSSPVRRIEIFYPPRIVELGSWEIPWFVAALVLMMGFSLMLGWLFGVRMA